MNSFLKPAGSLCALSLSLLPVSGQTVLIDFEAADTSPGGNWNTVTVAGGTNLTDFGSGATTTIDIRFSGGVNVSTNTGAWGTRTVAPTWTSGIADPVLSDRFWITEGGSGTMTISGLVPGQGYDIELASSYGGDGTSGNDVGIYELTDATGLVEGFNAYTLASLGTRVAWIPRGPGEGGVEGWLGWCGAVADGAGTLSFALSAPAGANPRIALNAMRIVAAGGGVDLPDVLAMTGTGEFCPDDGARVFGVEAPTEADVTYELLRDGLPVESLPGNGGPLAFGARTGAGVYHVIGTRSGYTVDMTGSATIFADCTPPTDWPLWSEMPRIQVVTNTASPDYPNFPESLRWFDFDSKTVDGPAINNPVEWYHGRRLEIIDMLEHYMYGRSPEAPASPSFTVVETLPDHIGGLATRLKVSMDFNVSGVPAKTLYVYLPNGYTPPYPVIAALAATTPADWEPGGARSNRWHMEQTLARGYALAIISVQELAGDIHNSEAWRNPLVTPYANTGFDGDWQIIAAWAWGLSRVIDYLDTRPDIDPDRTILTGYSRRGKACLWAGALDERVELVAPHQTGSGGTHPSRPGWGTALTFRTQFPNWFLDSFNILPMDSTDNGYERLPFDQHFPVALIAPRWAFLSENNTYGSNLAGLQAITYAASPAFDLLDPGNTDSLLLNWDFLYPTTHQFTAYHWADIMDQADKLPLAMGGIRAFLDWRLNSGHFSEAEAVDETVSGQLANPDHDSLPNLTEFATGTDPRSGSGAPMAIRAAPGGGLTIAFNARAGGRGHPANEYNAGGIGYGIEVSTTLGDDWQLLGETDVTWTAVPYPESPDWVRIGLTHNPAGGLTRAFYRLRVRLY
ncbi:MAG: hypothetical protein ACP5I4_13315 [Oceanipulchritudo sp.]